MMEQYFADIVDTEFTAELETKLDEVEEKKLDWKDILREFYPPFEKTLEIAEQQIEKVESRTSPATFPATSAAR
jgi:DNA topoisomerase-1